MMLTVLLFKLMNSLKVFKKLVDMYRLLLPQMNKEIKDITNQDKENRAGPFHHGTVAGPFHHGIVAVSIQDPS